MRYNIKKTFEYNKNNGPFEKIPNQNKSIEKILGPYGIFTEFFGFKTKLPIGVAAGPLYNKEYMTGAAKDGFNIITWKTFRSVDRLAHRNNGKFLGHNIVYLPDTTLTQKDTGKKIEGLLKEMSDSTSVSITNSFGMPSSKPSEWMSDVADLEEYALKNDKLIITSVVGTPKENGDVHSLANDYAFTARCAESAGAKIIEINLSCPNVSGAEGSIYKDAKNTAIISKRVKENFYNNDTKLLIKVGFADTAYYKKMLKACEKYIDGVVAINTIPMHIVDDKGKQALPGGETSGTCGNAIIDLSIEAVTSLVEARNILGMKFKIISCGGVTDAKSFMRHVDTGAEYVMCATAALFNPKLPLLVAKYIRDNKIKKSI